MERLHADDADEGLHRVVGEHAAAAADAGASMAGDVMAMGGIGMACHLIGADDIQHFAGFGILAGMDRAVRHDDAGLVMFEQGGERAHRRLVARDNGNRAGKA